jgi:hypothetical protein
MTAGATWLPHWMLIRAPCYSMRHTVLYSALIVNLKHDPTKRRETRECDP